MFFRRYAPALALILTLLLSACGSSSTPAVTTAPATAAPSVMPPTAAPPTASVPTAASTEAPPTAMAGGTITDTAGRSVTITTPPQRIISIAPSNTEILFALDLAPRIVAVDDFSDFPAAAKSLPKIGGANAKYNIEQIVALKPDLILAAGVTPPEVVKQLGDLKLTVVVLGTQQTTLDSIFSDITLAGRITGQTDQATRVTTAMQTQLGALKATLATAKAKPRVYWELDGTDPTKPFSVGPGNFVNDLIGLAGGSNIFQTASSPYPQVSAEQIVSADPEVIILSDAAYGISVESVGQRPGWQSITAVKQQRVAPIDDNLVSRPGPRIVDGLAATAKIIHPELFK
jgi:iron complex transport system substrate-binding protein